MVATTGKLIREARAEAGLSQRALGRVASVPQPAIARYENDLSLPTLPTLERLLSGCGRSLQLGSAPREGSPSNASSPRGRVGTTSTRVRHRRGAILEAARRRGVTGIRVFGSVARGTDGPRSDLDLLVDLAPDRTLLDLIGFQQDVADTLEMPVDVATVDMLRERARARATAEAIPL